MPVMWVRQARRKLESFGVFGAMQDGTGLPSWGKILGQRRDNRNE